MRMNQEREQIAAFGKKMVAAGFLKGTSGNLSIFNPELGLFAISPSGIAYDQIGPEDVVLMDLEGRVAEGSKKPSSEFEMHSVFYRERQDIRAILHTHSVFATTLACLRLDLPPVHYMIAVAGPNVRCAAYAPFGTKALADNALIAMKDRRAVLLANHGLLAGAETLSEACNIAEEIEYVAEIYCRTKTAGHPVILSENEMKEVQEKFKNYGQK